MSETISARSSIMIVNSFSILEKMLQLKELGHYCGHFAFITTERQRKIHFTSCEQYGYNM